MSSCRCSIPKTVRVSDEGIYNQQSGEDVRLRCCECGGKAGFLPLESVERLVPERNVKQYAEPGEWFPTVKFKIGMMFGTDEQ